jgi:hypothetical protein
MLSSPPPATLPMIESCFYYRRVAADFRIEERKRPLELVQSRGVMETTG